MKVFKIQHHVFWKVKWAPWSLSTVSGTQRGLRRPCIVATVYAETCLTLIYILGICDARYSKNYLQQKRQPSIRNYCCHWPNTIRLLAKAPESLYKYTGEAKCQPGHSVLRRLSKISSFDWSLGNSLDQEHPSEGVKNNHSPVSHITWWWLLLRYRWHCQSVQ